MGHRDIGKLVVNFGFHQNWYPTFIAIWWWSYWKYCVCVDESVNLISSGSGNQWTVEIVRFSPNPSSWWCWAHPPWVSINPIFCRDYLSCVLEAWAHEEVWFYQHHKDNQQHTTIIEVEVHIRAKLFALRQLVDQDPSRLHTNNMSWWLPVVGRNGVGWLTQPDERALEPFRDNCWSIRLPYGCPQ